MWHSLDNRLDALDTPVSYALSDGSSGRLLGTVGIPQRKNHTATDGPEQGQETYLIQQTGNIVSSVFKIKHSTRGTNCNLSFMQANPYTLRLTSPIACYCPITKFRTSCIQSFKNALR